MGKQIERSVPPQDNTALLKNDRNSGRSTPAVSNHSKGTAGSLKIS